MGNIEIKSYNKMEENKRWVEEKPLDKGGTKRIEVEKVSNGYIKTVTISKEGKDFYDCTTTRSIHEDNPMEEVSIVEKLKRVMEGNGQ